MATSNSTTATKPAKASKEVARESNSKEQIYIAIAEFVKEKTGKRIGKTGGRVIFDMAVSQAFAAAARDKSFRFNGGFGALHIRTYSAGSRRLPSGQNTTFGERTKLRYEEGVSVAELVKNGGDLSKVRQAEPAEQVETAADAAGEETNLD